MASSLLQVAAFSEHYFLETKNILCMKEEVEEKIVIALFLHFISA
jgi:hypothetical protein